MKKKRKSKVRANLCLKALVRVTDELKSFNAEERRRILAATTIILQQPKPTKEKP